MARIKDEQYAPPSVGGGQTQIVRFENAPRPGIRRGRDAAGSVALSVPPNFDARKPAVMVLYFHGFEGGVNDSVGRQRVMKQLAESGINAVMVAPLLGKFSEPGKFQEKGFAEKFLEEAAQRFAGMQGGDLQVFRNMPVVSMGYSGGYIPTGAFLSHSMRSPSLQKRVVGAMIFDGMYKSIMGTCARFAAQPHKPFIYSNYIAPLDTAENNKAFAKMAKGNVFIEPVQGGAASKNRTSAQALEMHQALIESGTIKKALRSIPQLAERTGLGVNVARVTPAAQQARYNPVA